MPANTNGNGNVALLKKNAAKANTTVIAALKAKFANYVSEVLPRIARENNCKKIAKSKSMMLEGRRLNERMAEFLARRMARS